MKQVTSWQDNQGNLHKSAMEAAIANLRFMSKGSGSAAVMSFAAAEAFIKNRKEVRKLFDEIDLIEAHKDIIGETQKDARRHFTVNKEKIYY